MSRLLKPEVKFAAPVSAVGDLAAEKVTSAQNQRAKERRCLKLAGTCRGSNRRSDSRDLEAQRAGAVAGASMTLSANGRSFITGTIPKTNAEDQKALLDARAKVNNARATFERRRTLFERGGISKKDLEAFATRTDDRRGRTPLAGADRCFAYRFTES